MISMHNKVWELGQIVKIDQQRLRVYYFKHNASGSIYNSNRCFLNKCKTNNFEKN